MKTYCHPMKLVCSSISINVIKKKSLPLTPSDASAIRLARCPRRVTHSLVNACATLGWRGPCVIPAGWDSSAFRHLVAEVQDFKNHSSFLNVQQGE